MVLNFAATGRKLRWRIALINMGLIGIVLIGIFTTLCINSFSNSYSELEHGMDRVIERNAKEKGFVRGAKKSETAAENAEPANETPVDNTYEQPEDSAEAEEASADDFSEDSSDE